MPKSDDLIADALSCECSEGCKMGLIIRKYPENKIKLQIFDGDNIRTVVISNEKLKKKLKEVME